MPSSAHLLPGLGDFHQPLIVSDVNGKTTDGRQKRGVDDLLQIYCGEFGSWQLRHFVLTSLAWALEAFHTMVMIFADRQPDWQCVSTACRAEAPLCSQPLGSWEWTHGPSGSTVSEWGLVCEDKYKVGLVQGLFFFGCMIGAGIFGHLSDSFLGRKGSLAVVCIMNAVLGCLTAFAPNYIVYTLLRFLTGFGVGGVGLCAFVLATEPVGPTKRGVAGMSTFYFFSGGIALLSGIAYVFQSWRALYIASSVPSIIFIVTVIPFLAESPRWYLVKGKTKEAMKVMHSIAQRNGRNIPQGVELALDDDSDSERGEVKGSLIDVLKSPVTRLRLFLAVAINFCCATVYYGLSLNVVNLDTNLYLNVMLNAVAEMPAFTLTAILIDTLGRKPLTVGTLFFSGGFCLFGALMKNYGTWKVLKMICGIFGIFGMAGTYNLLFIYTVELFPTVVRNAALGCTTQASQMGAILAPFVVVMGGGLPFAVFAACGFAGALLAFYLPETLNRPLYDTMTGMEEGEAVLSNE